MNPSACASSVARAATTASASAARPSAASRRIAGSSPRSYPPRSIIFRTRTISPRNAFTRGQPRSGAQLADALEDLVRTHGAHTIAAVIVEPVAGSTGVLVPPVGYLERLREICDQHGILLIFDEVITGLRPTRLGVRRHQVRRDAGHDDARERHHQRRGADGRRVSAARHLRRDRRERRRRASSCFTGIRTRAIRSPPPRAWRRSISTRRRGCSIARRRSSRSWPTRCIRFAARRT